MVGLVQLTPEANAIDAFLACYHFAAGLEAQLPKTSICWLFAMITMSEINKIINKDRTGTTMGCIMRKNVDDFLGTAFCHHQDAEGTLKRAKENMCRWNTTGLRLRTFMDLGSAGFLVSGAVAGLVSFSPCPSDIPSLRELTVPRASSSSITPTVKTTRRSCASCRAWI